MFETISVNIGGGEELLIKSATPRSFYTLLSSIQKLF